MKKQKLSVSVSKELADRLRVIKNQTGVPISQYLERSLVKEMK